MPPGSASGRPRRKPDNESESSVATTKTPAPAIASSRKWFAVATIENTTSPG